MKNTDAPLDMVGLALQLGATFVGAAGDKPQLVPLIKAAIKHKGAAFLDVVSPCVAFNNHPGSTKSYEYVREHNEAANKLDFIDVRGEIVVDYAEGELVDVTQHDGSVMRLRKLSASYSPHDRVAAMSYLHERQAKGEVVTGLLYVDAEAQDLHEHLAVGSRSRLGARTSARAATLAKINASCADVAKIYDRAYFEKWYATRGTR